MMRITRSMSRRLQEQKEQSTTNSSSTTENQTHLTGTTRSKRGKKKPIIPIVTTTEIQESTFEIQGLTAEIQESTSEIQETAAEIQETAAEIQESTSEIQETAAEIQESTIRETTIEIQETTTQETTTQETTTQETTTQETTTRDTTIQETTTQETTTQETTTRETITTVAALEVESSSSSAQQIPHSSKNTSLEQQVGTNLTGDAAATSTTTAAATNKRKGTDGSAKENRKSKKIKKPAEKRLTKFRTHCPAPINERINRAESQRIYMVSRKMIKECHQEFAILGSTGNIYTVTITHLPNCTCPDFKKGYLCKHIIFVYLRVLRVDRDSPYIYQRALLSEELRSIFANAAPDPTILANKRVRDKYRTITSGEAFKLANNTDDNRRPIEGDCPICYEVLEEKDRENIVWCKEGCGNNLHKDCFEQWKKSKRGGKVTCVYCRSDWIEPPVDSGIILNEEGYFNLGSVQGMNTKRDTSTYYHNYRTARNSWY